MPANMKSVSLGLKSHRHGILGSYGSQDRSKIRAVLPNFEHHISECLFEWWSWVFVTISRLRFANVTEVAFPQHLSVVLFFFHLAVAISLNLVRPACLTVYRSVAVGKCLILVLIIISVVCCRFGLDERTSSIGIFACVANPPSFWACYHPCVPTAT